MKLYKMNQKYNKWNNILVLYTLYFKSKITKYSFHCLLGYARAALPTILQNIKRKTVVQNCNFLKRMKNVYILYDISGNEKELTFHHGTC